MLPASISSSIIVRDEHLYSAVEEQRDVFESHRHHIFSVAYYMTGDEREAESILELTFLDAFRLQSQPSVCELDRALMDQLHRRLSLDPVPAVESCSARLNCRNVRRTDLEEALWELPARERLVFLLRDVEGYSPDRIAILLETPESDVKRTVFSARLRLRGLLAAQQPAAA
jgi:DNA-directed RNA polymerase specialized sigma24 family protein